MTGTAHTSTRDIARAAVRAELAQVACDLFRREGFDQVTVNDVAAAAGVSRSTFLRYFSTKEEAVLGACDGQGDQVADALRARPADEDDWTALRRALDTIVEQYRQNPAAGLTRIRLVKETPSLCAWNLEKQHGWRPMLAQVLAERADSPRPSSLALSVKVAAALDCLNITLDHWTTADGRPDLGDLLDEAFAALAAR